MPEAVELTLGVKHKMRCCDCGLVHDVIVTLVYDDVVEFAFTVDPEMTTKSRVLGEHNLEVVGVQPDQV